MSLLQFGHFLGIPIYVVFLPLQILSTFVSSILRPFSLFFHQKLTKLYLFFLMLQLNLQVGSIDGPNPKSSTKKKMVLSPTLTWASIVSMDLIG